MKVHERTDPTNDHAKTERKRFENVILQKSSNEIEQTIWKNAPIDWSRFQYDEVRGEVLERIQRSLVRLKITELQSFLDQQTHVNQAVAETMRLLKAPQPTRKDAVMKKITRELARTGLVPDDLSRSILEKENPAIEDIANELVSVAVDCEMAVRTAPESSWNERRLSRAILAGAFISALALLQGGDK